MKDYPALLVKAEELGLPLGDVCAPGSLTRDYRIHTPFHAWRKAPLFEGTLLDASASELCKECFERSGHFSGTDGLTEHTVALVELLADAEALLAVEATPWTALDHANRLQALRVRLSSTVWAIMGQGVACDLVDAMTERLALQGSHLENLARIPLDVLDRVCAVRSTRLGSSHALLVEAAEDGVDVMTFLDEWEKARTSRSSLVVPQGAERLVTALDGDVASPLEPCLVLFSPATIFLGGEQASGHGVRFPQLPGTVVHATKVTGLVEGNQLLAATTSVFRYLKQTSEAFGHVFHVLPSGTTRDCAETALVMWRPWVPASPFHTAPAALEAAGLVTRSALSLS